MLENENVTPDRADAGTVPEEITTAPETTETPVEPAAPEDARPDRRAETLRQAREFLSDPRAERALESEMRLISDIDPQVRSVTDVLRLPGIDRVYRYVAQGLRLSEAYILANFRDLRARQTEAGRQAARNEAAETSHLTATAGRGAGGKSVPGPVRELYRLLNPQATEAEIRQHYNRGE